MSSRNAAADGCLLVTCWCEETLVDIPVADVRAGITRPCRRKKCKALAQRHQLVG